MIDFTNCPVDEPWILFDSEGNHRVINTCAEFAYARLQIAKGALEGYYLKKTLESEEKYPINRYGVVHPYPEGLFDSWENMAGDIVRAAMNIRATEIKLKL